MDLKKIVGSWSLVLCCLSGWAQDRITLQTGEVQSVKIQRYDARLVHFLYPASSQPDSIPTERVREVFLGASAKRVVVIPAAMQDEAELIEETTYMQALRDQDASLLLQAKTVLSGVGFFTGRYLLTPDAQKYIAALAAKLKQSQVSRLEIQVHTDTVGKALTNLELSEKRAHHIKNLLLEKGFQEAQVSVMGQGEAMPMYGGASQQALNRRVELRILEMKDVTVLFAEKYLPPPIFREEPSDARPQASPPAAEVRESKRTKQRKVKEYSYDEPDPTYLNRAWVDYQLFTNRGKRPELVSQKVPPLGLHYERDLWEGLGVRASVGTHWWDENKLLAESDWRSYTQLFRYQYWVISGGLIYHYPVGSNWDPYVGALISFRWARASCDCYDLQQTTTSIDLLIGTRYLLGHRLFLLGELGNHGTGYLKLGAGLKL